MDIVRVSSIAKYIDQPFLGPQSDISIDGVSSVTAIKPQTLVFAADVHGERFLDLINKHDDIAVIASLTYAAKIRPAHILTQNPKLDFAMAFAHFFPPEDTEMDLGVNVGERCLIDTSARVNNVMIGNGCVIKANTVIGQKGFSFIPDADGVPFPMPHKGRVIIGDNVEIGACNTIARGVLDDTVIGDNVKTDDQVHIAHNCRIGENTMITAGTVIAGSVTIGKNVWIAPNCTILNHVTIGDGAFVCIGSVVGKDVKPNTKVFGCPARKV